MKKPKVPKSAHTHRQGLITAVLVKVNMLLLRDGDLKEAFAAAVATLPVTQETTAVKNIIQPEFTLLGLNARSTQNLLNARKKILERLQDLSVQVTTLSKADL